MNRRLLVFKIARREIALVVLAGLTIEYAQTRAMTADPRAARTTCETYVRWALDRFEANGGVIIEALEDGIHGPRTRELVQSARDTVEAEGYRPSLIQPHPLKAAFRHPECASREEVRRLIANILRQPDLSPSVLDALALGFYSEIQRLLELQYHGDGAPLSVATTQ